MKDRYIVALWSSFLIASSDCVLAGGPVAARTAVTPAVSVKANQTCLRAPSCTASPGASKSLATPRSRSPPSTLRSSLNPPTSLRSTTARRRTRPTRSTTTALATTTTTTITATAARWWRPSTCLTTRPLPRLTSSSPRGCSVRTARCTRVSQVSNAQNAVYQSTTELCTCQGSNTTTTAVVGLPSRTSLYSLYSTFGGPTRQPESVLICPGNLLSQDTQEKKIVPV